MQGEAHEQEESRDRENGIGEMKRVVPPRLRTLFLAMSSNVMLNTSELVHRVDDPLMELLLRSAAVDLEVDAAVLKHQDLLQ